MPVIRVYLYDKGFGQISHLGTHIAARVFDEQSRQQIYIEYSPRPNLNGIKYPGESSDYIDLYSDKDFSEFVEAYKQKFKAGDYRFLKKNCADAVNFVLDHFFPGAYEARLRFEAERLACCLPGIAFFSAKCMPAPLYISTPAAVFAKAKRIEEGVLGFEIVQREHAEHSSAIQPDKLAPERMVMK